MTTYNMKLYLIGPGFHPIPPTGWGAIESLIWDYYENLKRYKDIEVEIINETDLVQVITKCNSGQPDVVHIMYDDYVVIAPHLQCKCILYSSHYAYITDPSFKRKYKYYFENIFKKVIENQNYITIHSISPKISDVYKQYGFRNTIRTVCNGAREDLFRYTERPLYLTRSIYLAKIEFRKSQYKYQTIPSIDFVGNYYDSPFDTKRKNYLGEWSKTVLYENLTDYGNLILLSEGEADPLVVKEALVAGLGVVISECSAANLDLSLPFITVIPDDRLLDIEYIHYHIEQNRQYSVVHREQIRDYALSQFSWKSIIERYVKTIRDTLQ